MSITQHQKTELQNNDWRLFIMLTKDPFSITFILVFTRFHLNSFFFVVFNSFYDIELNWNKVTIKDNSLLRGSQCFLYKSGNFFTNKQLSIEANKKNLFTNDELLRNRKPGRLLPRNKSQRKLWDTALPRGRITFRSLWPVSNGRPLRAIYTYTERRNTRRDAQ